MSELILSVVDCEPSSTTVTTTEPTQFILSGSDATATIALNGIGVTTLRPSNRVYYAEIVGEYEIRLQSSCGGASVYTNVLTFNTSVINGGDCNSSNLDTDVPVTGRVSIVGSERPLHVRVIEQCDQNNDYEIACASDDGRLVIIDTTSTPPILRELDGSPVPGGVTAVSCDTEYITVNKCYETIADPTIQYTQVVVYPVGDPGSATVIWLDDSGSVVAEPTNIQPCSASVDDSCSVLTASGTICYDGGEDGTLQAFVFHDCEGNATYRDTVTNALVASPTIIDCPTSGGGGGGGPEVICASTDGRLILIDTSVVPATLSELDGSPIADGATAVACAGDSGPLVDQTHVLSHGTDIDVPAGMKSVTIVRLTGSPVVDGGFTLGDSPYPQSVTYNASEVVGARALLPAITIAGGTWQWTAVLPVAEE